MNSHLAYQRMLSLPCAVVSATYKSCTKQTQSGLQTLPYNIFCVPVVSALFSCVSVVLFVGSPTKHRTT